MTFYYDRTTSRTKHQGEYQPHHLRSCLLFSTPRHFCTFQSRHINNFKEFRPHSVIRGHLLKVSRLFSAQGHPISIGPVVRVSMCAAQSASRRIAVDLQMRKLCQLRASTARCTASKDMSIVWPLKRHCSATASIECSFHMSLRIDLLFLLMASWPNSSRNSALTASYWFGPFKAWPW